MELRGGHEKIWGGCVGLPGNKEELGFGLIEGNKVVRAPFEDETEITINGGDS